MIVWQLTWVISWSFFVFSVAVAMFSAHHDYRPTAAGPGVPNLGWLRMRTTAPVEVSLFKAKRCLHGVSLFWCDLKHCYVMLQPGILIGGDWNHGMEKMTFQKQLGMENHPNWLIFFRGVGIPPTSITHNLLRCNFQVMCQLPGWIESPTGCQEEQRAMQSSAQ